MGVRGVGGGTKGSQLGWHRRRARCDVSGRLALALALLWANASAPGRVAAQVQSGAQAQAVTEPVSALVAACEALGISRLAFLSPCVEAVSDRLRDVLGERGVETPVFGSFAEGEEAKVVRIAPESTRAAARALLEGSGAEGVFLSCTNLDTLDIIAPLEAECGIPVLSSNLVLAWHMMRLAGLAPSAAFGKWRLGQV